MDEPEEPASPAMRRVFDELEAEFQAGLRREAEQETVVALRAGIGATVLWEQLARRIGGETVAFSGPARSGGSSSRAIPSSWSGGTSTAAST